jgi:uncharacterized protein (TIGR04141 family)
MLTALTCYRIRRALVADAIRDPNAVLGPDVAGFERTEVVQHPDFSAWAFVIRAHPRAPEWATFLSEGFPGLTVGLTGGPSALLIVRAAAPDRRRQDVMFAFTFGAVGRFVLRSDGYERGYGLRTALNLIYPRGSAEAARLRAIDSKRRGQMTVRSRFQSSELADLEVFDINYLRDLVGKAHGIPSDTAVWGRRVGGGDSLTLDRELQFDELGQLCRDIEVAHSRDDYTDRFSWIDSMQQVTDPVLLQRLEEAVISDLQALRVDKLDLAPPEIIDWDRVVAFRYHYDRPHGPARARVTHPDLRIGDYLSGLPGGPSDLSDARQLRSRSLFAVDQDGNDQHRWSVWKCLVGEVTDGVDTFILDEGDFFRVSDSYIADLDEAIRAIPRSSVSLPTSSPTLVEEAYNRQAADASGQLLLLDRQTVRITARTTPIEICDLLSSTRQLIHVKRHLGSSDLSHLFAQGFVSAELMQSSQEFRRVVRSKIAELASGRSEFGFIEEGTFQPSEFEVAYAIIERWRGRSMTEALPFFSKINLREVATNLRARGFRVTLTPIEAIAAPPIR